MTRCLDVINWAFWDLVCFVEDGSLLVGAVLWRHLNETTTRSEDIWTTSAVVACGFSPQYCAFWYSWLCSTDFNGVHKFAMVDPIYSCPSWWAWLPSHHLLVMPPKISNPGFCTGTSCWDWIFPKFWLPKFGPKISCSVVGGSPCSVAWLCFLPCHCQWNSHWVVFVTSYVRAIWLHMLYPKYRKLYYINIPWKSSIFVESHFFLHDIQILVPPIQIVL